uniref:Uncharacterized protein n=1 Tax=Oryza meridionalis TaxID=40149 RepID=A0A0E0DHH6_9ORYZ
MQQKLAHYPAAAAAGPGKAGHHNAGDFHAVAAGGVAPPAETTRWPSLAATAASLVAVGLGGAALLVWWALAFHPANARLWMVPAGLST